MALEALEQVCAECRNRRADKTRAFAFSLAYLWQEGGGDRWRDDGFWKAATGDPESFTGWSRFTDVTGFLSGIYHAHGMCRTAEIQSKFDSLYNPDNVPGMCNHYRNDPEARESIQTWREYIAWDSEATKAEMRPKYQGVVGRTHEGQNILDAMQWGFPLKMKGKRPGTTVTKRITNVRILSSSFWRSMLTKPENRCLVPFTQFAEPKPNAGREEVWFKIIEEQVSAFAGIWRKTDEGNA